METHPDFYGQILEGLSDTLVDTSARALFALEAPENFPLEIKTQNRRRIIIGGLVYRWMKEDDAYAAQILAHLDRWLTKDIDRKLFF